ncbi:unnamed protein product [Penicillium manginii]
MANPRTTFSRDLVHIHERQLDLLLQQGVFKPIFFYHIVLFFSFPLIGLVIPRRPGTQYVRPLLFAIYLGFAIEILRSHRALPGGSGYVVGLLTGWWLVWTATLFVCTDVEHDFQRIERHLVAEADPPASTSHNTLIETFENDMEWTEEDSESEFELSSKVNPPTTGITKGTDQHDKLYWQSYPKEFLHRFVWCFSLFFNFRGPDWNWRSSCLGPLPPSVYAQLYSGFASRTLYTEDYTAHFNSKDRLRAALATCLKSYLLLDILKVVMMRDPYFRGISAPDPVPPFPFSYFALFPLVLRLYHCFFGGIYMYFGLSLAFPKASRKLTSTPLDAPWLYPPTFGPFVSSVLDDGLAGWWGRFWHQLFRYGFSTPARWMLSLLPSSWSADSRVKRITYLVVSFSLSGFVHACGSYTQFTDTYPLSGPFLFFFLQSIGVIFEDIFKTLISSKVPLAPWRRAVANGAGSNQSPPRTRAGEWRWVVVLAGNVVSLLE